VVSSVQISGSLFVILEHTHVSQGWNAKKNYIFSFIITQDNTCHVEVSNGSKRKCSIKISFFNHLYELFFCVATRWKFCCHHIHTYAVHSTTLLVLHNPHVLSSLFHVIEERPYCCESLLHAVSRASYNRSTLQLKENFAIMTLHYQDLFVGCKIP